MDYPCKYCDEKEEESVKNHNIKKCSKPCGHFKDWVRCERMMLMILEGKSVESIVEEMKGEL